MTSLYQLYLRECHTKAWGQKCADIHILNGMFGQIQQKAVGLKFFTLSWFCFPLKAKKKATLAPGAWPAR